MKVSASLFLIVVGLGLVGCSHQIKLSPTLTPNALSSDPIQKSTAVYFTPDVVAYAEKTNPSSFSGSAHTYNVDIGASLTACLEKAVDVVYEPVVVVDEPPSAGEYDRVIKFSMQNSDLDVSFQEGFLSSNAKSQYTVSVTIEAYDGESMEVFGKSSVTGNSFGSENAGAFNASEAFRQTVETGVQQTCDSVASLLVGGFAEGRSGPDGMAETVESVDSAGQRYDDLLKLKSLLDQGVISEEEFEAEKSKLLGDETGQ
jgi:hypothetical protein